MQSTPSRCKLPSIAAAMLAAFSAAGPPRSHVMPPGPATLVATVKASRPCGCFLSQAPRISSDRPCSKGWVEWCIEWECSDRRQQLSVQQRSDCHELPKALLIDGWHSCSVMLDSWPTQLACVSAACGTGYISAVSKKLAPASAASLSNRSATSGGVLSPNSMVPGSGSETASFKGLSGLLAERWPSGHRRRRAAGGSGGAPKQSVGTCRSVLPSCLRSRPHAATLRRLRGGRDGAQPAPEQRPAAVATHSALMHADHVQGRAPTMLAGVHVCPAASGGQELGPLC